MRKREQSRHQGSDNKKEKPKCLTWEKGDRREKKKNLVHPESKTKVG